MNYRKDKYGNDIPALGFGCLRFKRKNRKIDMLQAEEQIMAAFEAGVNYFDTAYIYPGSEAALGEILSKNNIREKVYICDKLPHYLIHSRDGLEKMFREQLHRLKTDHIDYYLCHMLTDVDTWQRLKALDIESWLEEKKAAGQIGQVGFSYHGGSDMFCRLLDEYDWDCCLVQYNYLDEHSQAGRRGVEYAASKGIPVFIMEPLRGGRLVNDLPKQALDIFASYPVVHTPAQWALRWLWDQSAVTCVLSGMNSLEMLRDNVETACDAGIGQLGEKDQEMLRAVVREINGSMRVGCTACGYCMPCPAGVDIPGCFAALNRTTENRAGAKMDYLKCTALRKNASGASKCIGCGKCEKHCPQSIDIRAKLSIAAKEMEGPFYKLLRTAAGILKAF
ncbi:MAG: aldo/keto reductase [Firmicutes bacterium]|nr:aldo/keto reductase [Bacillota bacterium]